MMQRSAVVVAAAILVLCGGAPEQCGAQTTDAREAIAASVPRLVQFNGTLKDSAARPVSGVASVTFAIYADQDGGSSLWSETQNVLADSNGHFNALLGTATTGGFPSELFSTGQSRWLGITIARQPEMPRVMLASVPYAMKAGDADTLGGLPASSYVTAQQLAARIAAPGTTLIASPSVVGGTPIVNNASAASASPGTADGAATGASAQSATQATITGTGTANYLPLWTSGTNLGVSKIYQANGGFVGINTATPLLQLDVNGNSIFRGSFQLAPQGTATPSASQPSHSFQWQGSVYNTGTKSAQNLAFGFRTVPYGNDTGYPGANLDLFFGPGGGTLTDTGFSIGENGIVNFLPNQPFNGAVVTANQVNLKNVGADTATFEVNSVPYLSAYGTSDSIYAGPYAGGGGAETTGSFGNAALGYQALYNNTSGVENLALGYQALQTNQTGGGNVGVGYFALQKNLGGLDNTGVGPGALLSNVNGDENAGFGFYAGQSNVSGNYDLFMGYGADVAATGTYSNATAIGANALVAESNAMVLGSTDSQFYVNIGVGTNTPKYQLHVVDTNFSTAPVGVESSVAGRNAIFASNYATSGQSNGIFTESLSPSGAAIEAENLNGGYAGYFIGNVSVTGTLTKGGGSFKIDDPIDPAGKYLSHSFVESPDMKNIYDGIVTLDAHGSAVITMPDWFSALNRDFRYQLTAIGAPGPKLYIAEEMHDNTFRIAGGKKNMRVSWEVTGIRQDAWANAHRIPNEETKPADEQGRYLHPELFGAGADQQIGVAPAAAAPANASATPASTGAGTESAGQR